MVSSCHIERQMLDSWHHFIRPTLILWLISSSMSPSLYSMKHKYLKLSFPVTTWPSKLVSPSYVVRDFNFVSKFSKTVFDQSLTFVSLILNRNPFETGPVFVYRWAPVSSETGSISSTLYVVSKSHHIYFVFNEAAAAWFQPTINGFGPTATRGVRAPSQSSVTVYK